MPYKKRLVYLPDPAVIDRPIDRQEARILLHLPEAAFVILIYGAITGRKGLDRLLAASADPTFPKNAWVLIAGDHDPELSSFLQLAIETEQLGTRVKVIDQFIDADLEPAIYSAADAVWMGYDRHYGMSSVLVQAGILGIPVIACSEGVIGWVTRRAGSGIVVNTRRTEEIVLAVRTLAENATERLEYSTAARLAYAGHSVANSARLLTESIEHIDQSREGS